jgi:hypothetical protein
MEVLFMSKRSAEIVNQIVLGAALMWYTWSFMIIAVLLSQ